MFAEITHLSFFVNKNIIKKSVNVSLLNVTKLSKRCASTSVPNIPIFYFCMVKMAHAPLPNLVYKPLNTSNMCPTNFTATNALADVLKSDPVKRLFNQPNIIIKTIPLKTQETSVSNNNIIISKTNNLNFISTELKQPEVSATPLQMDIEYNNEDENLLPSKKKGKSEIALVPIKREKKPCGHYEPCENIVCDVAVQQYVDRDRASPMLAINIEEDEINAPVSKHCTNEKCDALSIDHDRCRRAIVRLNRCNRSSACDICGIMLKTPRSRIHHKNCTRKNEYRHNEVDSAQILKERMREREIQIIEASKAKRNDYMDPVTGNNLAMETLKNNEELIIIPKSVPIQQPVINITSVTTTQLTQPTQPTQSTQSTPQISNVNNVFRNILPNIPIVLPQQSIVIGKTPCSNENNITTPVQVALPDTLNRPLIATTSAVPLSQNQYLTFATQHNAQPITLNDLLFSQSQFVTTSIQPKSLLTPIRVVPITNLITQPSLLHQTQGIPKFCIMTDNTVATPVTITNPQTVQHSTPVPKVSIPQNHEVVNNSKTSPQKKRKTPIRKKRKLRRKDFKCDYCHKRFSTDWYFKIHVAKHTGEKQFSCKICTQSFINRYDMKRHMTNEHKDESILNTNNQQTTEQSSKCSDCSMEYMSVDDLKHHRQKCHGITECTLCHKKISEEELDRHMISAHKESDTLIIKEEIIINDNNSDDMNDMEVLSNSIETKVNNCDSQQEDNAAKMEWICFHS